MDLPTYTSIWRIEKRLYKLYDFRLPMPLPIGQISVFAAITVPYVVLLTVLGLPFNHTLIWLYILPPGLLTWLATRPVLEGKRLPELVKSQVRFVTEPRVWCRMAQSTERDVVVVTARAWRPASAGYELAMATGQSTVRSSAAPAEVAADDDDFWEADSGNGKDAQGAGFWLSGKAPERGLARSAQAVRDPAPGRGVAPGLAAGGMAKGGLSAGRLGPGRVALSRRHLPGLPESDGPAPAVPGGTGLLPAGERLADSTDQDWAAEHADRDRLRSGAAPAAASEQDIAAGRGPVAAGQEPGGRTAAPRRDAPLGPPPAWPGRGDIEGHRTGLFRARHGAGAGAPGRPAPDRDALARHASDLDAQAARASNLDAPGEAARDRDGPGRHARGDEASGHPDAGRHAGPGTFLPPAPTRHASAPAADAVSLAKTAVPGTEARDVDARHPGERAPRAGVFVADHEARPQEPGPDGSRPATGAPAPAAQRPVVTVVGGASAQASPPAVERALAGPSARRGDARPGRVVVVPGGHRPGRPDQLARDRTRAQQPIGEPSRIVVLGCTVGAGQTITALLIGEMLASLRPEHVAVLDLNPGPGSLARRAQHRPALSQAASLVSSRLVVLGQVGPSAEDDADGHGARPRPGEDAERFDFASQRYDLVFADPSTAAVPRLLPIADQLVLVAPASAAAASSIAMTFEWLDAHRQGRLAAESIMVLNGVSRRSLANVEQAERVCVGRCRAIVRVPWDDQLNGQAVKRTHPTAPGGRAGQRWAGLLSPATAAAYTALAGVLVSALAGRVAAVTGQPRPASQGQGHR